jgi:hypothetical protein
MYSKDSLPVFSWLVCQGTAVWQPPDTPHKFRGKPLKTPQKATPLYHYGYGRGDVLFAPSVDGTHRQLQSKCDGRSYWWVQHLKRF